MLAVIKRFSLIGLLVMQCSYLQAKQAPSAKTFDIKDYQGKVVYLDFWASWCIPCRKSFPWMNKIRQEYSQDDLVIIAINLDKEWQLAQRFLEEYPANFEILFDPKGSLAKKYQIKGMPSSIIFNREGKPVSAHTGFFLEKIEQYDTEIKQLISPSDQKSIN